MYNYKSHLAAFTIQKYTGWRPWTWVPLENGTEVERMAGGVIHKSTFTRRGALRKAKRWIRYDKEVIETYYDSNGNLL